MRRYVVLTLVLLSVFACILNPVPPTPIPPTLIPPPTITLTPVSGPCEITPVNAVTAYVFPSAASNEFGTMTPSETYPATAKTADGFYGFDPGVAQAGNSGIFRLRWVLKTHDLTTSAGCADIPTVVGPITGLCYVMLMTDTPVYSSADTTSSVLATLNSDDFVMVTASASGWLTLDLNVGSVNMDNIGYIEDSTIGGLKGACDGL